MGLINAYPCAEPEHELLALLAQTQRAQAVWLQAHGANVRARVLRTGADVIEEHLAEVDAQARAQEEAHEKDAAAVRAMEGEQDT